MGEMPGSGGEVSKEEGPEPPQFPHANIVAVRVFADVLRSTVGPHSHDKMVVNQLETRSEPANPAVPPTNEIAVTGDGATVLEELPSEHPVTSVVMRITGPERKGETDVVGQDIPDGVSTSVVFLGALLEAAEALIDQGIHPYDIIQGYHEARRVALETLDAAARPLDSFDDPMAAARGVARTAMTGNDVGGFADTWPRLAVQAAEQVGRPDEETLVVRQISKGAIAESRLIQGAVLDMNHRVTDEMPRRVEDATVLVLGGYKRSLQDPEAWMDATIEISSPDDVAEMDQVYADRRAAVAERLEALGVDVIVARLGISREYADLLAERNIMGIRSVNRLDLKQVALATGAEIVKNPEDFAAEDLGYAGLVEEVQREPRRHRRKSRHMTVFEDCPNPESVVMLLHGVTDQIAEHATNQVRKATAAVADAHGEGASPPGVVPGGGAIEVELAEAVEAAATGEASRAQLAMEAFANALYDVPAALVYNAGADRIDVLADLRAAYAEGQADAGFILPAGIVGSASDAGVLDPVAVKRRMLTRATEVAEALLRIDDAIDAEFTEEPAGPEDSIYDEEAEKHMDFLESNDDTRWDT